MNQDLKTLFSPITVLLLITIVGCSSMKTPATADAAVSIAAVNNGVGTGGRETYWHQMKIKLSHA